MFQLLAVFAGVAAVELSVHSSFVFFPLQNQKSNRILCKVQTVILIKVKLFVSNLNIKSLGYKGGNIMLTVIAY